MNDKGLEKKLDEWISSGQLTKEDQLTAVVGKLSAIRSVELSAAIHEVKYELSTLTSNIIDSTNKIIKSNENLSKSNGVYSSSMNKLTLALVVIGVLQVITQIVQIFLGD